MTDPLYVRCKNCFLKWRRMVRIACTCGMIICGPVAYSVFNDGDVRNTVAPVAAFNSTATGTNVSLDSTVALAMPIADPLTYQVREVPGPGFNSMMRTVAGEQLKVAPAEHVAGRRSYKGTFRYEELTVTDVSSGTSLKPPNPRST
jgi:hypothetical protein